MIMILLPFEPVWQFLSNIKFEKNRYLWFEKLVLEIKDPLWYCNNKTITTKRINKKIDNWNANLIENFK